MNNSRKAMTLKVPVDAKMIKIAEKLSKQQRSQQKGREVYRNTLAVLAVDFYFQCMGIDTDLEKSPSWDSIIPSLMNTASLFIKGKGLLECRPVLPEDEVCYIPPEVWSDRIGYLVVKINEADNQAQILGFFQSVQESSVPISKLSPLQDFLIYLHKLEIAKVADATPDIIGAAVTKVSEKLVHLSEWFEGLFDDGWEVSVASTKEVNPVHVAEQLEVGGAKIVHLMHLAQSAVLILSQTQVSQNELEILLRLYPADNSIFLPDGVTMTVLDNEDNPIPQLSKQAKANNWLQLKFKGNVGDTFSLRISLGDDNFTEKFVI